MHTSVFVDAFGVVFVCESREYDGWLTVVCAYKSVCVCCTKALMRWATGKQSIHSALYDKKYPLLLSNIRLLYSLLAVVLTSGCSSYSSLSNTGRKHLTRV